eukprot:6732964-Prorocentrum_lima.AAC.1
MTSSLVGSEMCIRDSSHTTTIGECTTAGDYSNMSPTLQIQAIAEQAHIPVSYTHLTLPTICSV